MVEEPDQPEGGDETVDGQPSEPPPGVGEDASPPDPDAEAERRRAEYREVLSRAPPLKPSKDRTDPS